MTLRDVIGHERAVDVLRRLIDRGRMPAALILDGPPGVGRRTLAMAAGRALLCEEPAAGDACGRCTACKLVAEGAHPDCVVLPLETATATIKVETVRDEIVAAAGESALVGSRRVFVLPGVERLRSEAANALLKVLEEPPAGVHLIMTTANAGGLLKTIRSRSQLLRLGALTTAAVAAILEGGGVERSRAAERAAMGGGSHRGLWDDTAAEPPLEALRALLASGYDARLVCEVVDGLPQRAADVPEGATLSAEQRRVLAAWLAVLAEDLRADLRGEDPGTGARWLDRVLRALHDLRVNIQPRLVVEGLAVG